MRRADNDAQTFAECAADLQQCTKSDRIFEIWQLTESVPLSLVDVLIQQAHPGDAPIPVPYTSKLMESLMIGQTINVHGRINSDADNAEVNLLYGAPQIDPGQAVLHVKFRFNEKKLVMNTYMDGTWGKEERESLPFKPGENYDLKIRLQAEGFEIWCNEKMVRLYKHRIPFSRIEYLQVKGDCTLNGVHWGGRFYKIPWESGFPDGHLRSGQRILMHGIPKGDRWSLNLLGRGGDILFHFNPRLKEKKIIRNSCKGGTWNREEREGPFPFEKERGFDLTIQNEPYSIQIFVNNARIGTFGHRTSNPTQDYIGVKVDGDVEMTNIEFD